MKLVVLSALVPLLLATGVAAAGPDLVTTITPPAPTTVYATGRYTVKVANTGNQHANNVTLTIALPVTSTSPQVFVMGNLGAYGPVSPTVATCSRIGNNLSCALGQVRRNKSSSVYFDIALPQRSAPIIFGASAPLVGDNNPANNTASHTATVVYVSVAGYPDDQTTATNRHCTGTNLSAFFECTKFPSSISSHTADFHAAFGGATTGTITIPGYPDYSGSWTVTGTHLSFEYLELGVPAANFEGEGVRSTATEHCYEGLTRFPDGLGGWSTYVAPYEVCFAPTAP